jgi:hypothetical protein
LYFFSFVQYTAQGDTTCPRPRQVVSLWPCHLFRLLSKKIQLSVHYFCCFLIAEWLKFSRKFIRVLDWLSLSIYPWNAFFLAQPAPPYYSVIWIHLKINNKNLRCFVLVKIYCSILFVTQSLMDKRWHNAFST